MITKDNICYIQSKLLEICPIEGMNSDGRIFYSEDTTDQEKQAVEYYLANLDFAAINVLVKRQSMTPLSAYQVRKGLTQFNLRSQVEAAISQADISIKDAWQFANEFERTNPVLLMMAQALGITDNQLDQMFELGASL